MSKVPLFRGAVGGLLSYRSASNMDLRDGTIKPSPRLLRIRGITNGHRGDCTPTIVRWTYFTFPRPWYSSYDYILIGNAGSETAVNVGNAITDICEFEDGSGNAALILCYGNTDFIDRFDASVTATASTDVKLLYATMAGPDLYAITNGGAYSTCKISKCPAGNDPNTAAKWGTGYPVGSPLRAANSLRSFGGSPFVGKPEGLFVLSETGDKYINRFKWLTSSPHSDNCKGMFEAKTGVVVPLADGSLWLTDGYSFTDISPRKHCVPHRDAPWLHARITAGCDAGEWTYVATAPWEQGWTQEHSLTIFKCVTGTPNVYTDLTTNITDAKDSTTASIAGLVNGDYLYIGASKPFEGFKLKMGTVATTGTHDRIQYYGSGGWTSIGGASTIYDNTYQAGVAFAKNGFTFWRDFYTAHSSMVADSLADIATNGTATSDLYWVRIPITATISAGTTVIEVEILPSRPPISSAAALAYTGPDAAGRFSHILAGREGKGGWEWHDLFAIPVDSEITAMAMVQYDSGQAEENRGPRLLMLGQHSRFYALMGSTDNPATPVNENYTDGSTVGTPVVYFLPNDLSDADSDRATVQKKPAAFDIYGEYVNGSDTLTMLCRMDHNPWDTAQAVSTAPAKIAAPNVTEGLKLETALAYEDPNATEIAGPRITAVDVEFTDSAAEFDAHPQASAATPELE